MARTPKPNEPSRLPDPPATVDASSLPTAELHELETFKEPSGALKGAAAVMKAMAEAAAEEVADAPPPAAEPEGPSLKDVAEAKKRETAKDPAQKIPGWAKVPAGEFRFPKHRQVLFIRFRAEWTDTPGLGDRQIICWGLSPGDENFAIQRAMGDVNRITAELCMQTIRAIDGEVVDWAGMSQQTPTVFWGQIGRKCRELVLKTYLKLNTLSAAETRDFLETCLAVVTVG